MVSTTTVLERPWLKLCFTVPALTDAAPRGFRVRGARPPGTLDRPLLFSSLMRSLYKAAGRRPGPVDRSNRLNGRDDIRPVRHREFLTPTLRKERAEAR